MINLLPDIIGRIADTTQAPRAVSLIPLLPASRENAFYVLSELLGFGIIGDGLITEAFFNENAY